eukprot:TRINITY_DN10698_c0_g2_i1.p2 TRINITY_DN10698_c0_g2~~TRINITY_DN10698_c0_g2_i1.p2  ORF type:complete len:117 (-),score=7.90 TRINITY_DN10698_c0_g2_i1:179-529(-)
MYATTVIGNGSGSDRVARYALSLLFMLLRQQCRGGGFRRDRWLSVEWSSGDDAGARWLQRDDGASGACSRVHGTHFFPYSLSYLFFFVLSPVGRREFWGFGAMADDGRGYASLGVF